MNTSSCSMNNQNQPCIDDGVTVLSQTGGGTQLSSGISGNILNLKTLLAGANITLNDSGTAITISSSGSAITFTSGVGGVPLYTAGPPNVFFRSLISGVGIAISSTPNTFSFANSGVVNVVNLGSGNQIASLPIVSSTLNLRTLTGGGAITLTTSLNAIDISTPVLTLTSLAGGSSLIGSTFPNATLRSLVAGTNMSLVSSANTITINNTMTPTNTVTSLGGGAQVLIDVLAGSVRARTLVSQGYAQVNQSGNTITIGALGPVNIGTGEPVYAGNVGFDNQFKSLLANGNIQVTSDASNIYFRPYINSVIPYSGKTILNTYLSGNPELADFLGFATNIPVTSIDAFPADYTTLPTAFVGWVSPYRAVIKLVDTFIKFSIPTTITERLDIYCAIHRCKENDVGMNLIWFDTVFSTNANITAGDFIQRSFSPNVDVDVRWHLYFSFFAHRPDALGSLDLVEFYTSSSMLIQSQDAF